MRRAEVIVVGGGLAGLRAAVACADAGLSVHLLEARPRLGGATWTLVKDGLALDNGQHVFLRCCTEYRAFLDRLGVGLVDLAGLLWLQRRRQPTGAVSELASAVRAEGRTR